MSQKQNYIIPFWFLFLALLFKIPVNAQSTFVELEKLPVFSSENEIVNGEMWIYQKKYAGHPFWNEDKWYNGYIIYNGARYDSLTIRYDIYSNDVIIFKEVLNKTRMYKLNKELIKEFAFYNSSLTDTVVFYYISLDNDLDKTFYEIAYNGNCKYYISYRKTVNNKVGGGFTGEYLYSPKCYAQIDENIVEFRSNSEFLNLFNDKKNKIKKYMREQRIKFKKQSPENLSSVFQYYDSLTNSSLNN